jgi:hypothetical protein
MLNALNVVNGFNAKFVRWMNSMIIFMNGLTTNLEIMTDTMTV